MNETAFKDGHIQKEATSVVLDTSVNIKVGYIDLPNLYMTSSDADKVSKDGTIDIIGGYGYSVLNALSEYTNWTYSFIDGSYAEQITALEKGAIDLLLPTGYTEERAALFSFAKDVDIYNIISAIYTKSDASASDLYYNDDASVKKIGTFGLIQGNYVNDSFFEYATKISLDISGDKIKYYSTNEELKTALLNDDIDAMVAGKIAYSGDIKMISEISASLSYIAAKDEDLASKVNTALLSLNAEKPNFLSDTYSTFYGRYRSKKAYTQEESDYVSPMKGKKLKIVGNHSFEPFESYDADKGTYVGAYPDVVSLVSKESGVDIEFVETESLSSSWNTIKDGDADLISGVYVDGTISRDYNVLPTTSFYSYQNYLVMKRGSSLTPSSTMNVAVRSGFIGTTSYLNSFYPKWSLSTYNEEESGLQDLLNGKVDAALFSNVVINSKRLLAGHSDIYAYPSFSVSVPLCIGAYSGMANVRIVQGLISKVIDNIPADSITECLVNNTVGSGSALAPQEIFLSNLPLFISLIVAGAVLIAALAAFLAFFITERRSSKKLTAKNEELQRALQLAESYEKSRDEVDKLLDSAQCGILQISAPLHENHKSKMHLVFANDYASVLTGLNMEKCVNYEEFSKNLDNNFSSGIMSLICKTKGQKVGNSVESSFPAFYGNKTLDALAKVIAIFPKTDEKIIQITIFDVSERSAVEKELLVLSETDSLTGLLNKKTTEEAEADYLSKFVGSPCALLLMDIDKFKLINDVHGHPIGDEVLIAFSSYLKRLLPADSIIGRIGGDEFAVLLKDASDRAQLKKIGASITSFGKTYIPRFTCSLGIKIITQPEKDFAGCYKKVDGLLYFSKRLGTGHFTIR